MKIADKPLNNYTIIIEDAETIIKQTIKNSYLISENKNNIENKINIIIKNTVKKIKIKSLALDTDKSLRVLARRTYEMLVRVFGFNGSLLAATIAFNSGKSSLPTNDLPTLQLPTNAKGVPLQQYYKEVYSQKVIPIMKRLIDLKALDPNDERGQNTLRNLSEMEVRYNAHLDDISLLKSRGVKLVTSSVHADCSDRCFKWQGRIYSLDGSSGITSDGKRYVPLEIATDVYYTTKAGRVYKNGLLGFNCRHKLYEYTPQMVIPTVTKEQQAKEYNINNKQRLYEKQVRTWREEALTYKEVDREKYLFARKKAIEWNKRYIEFSHSNGRAYYPDRTKIL